MNTLSPYRVGLLGLGNVGLQVAQQIVSFREDLEQRSGRAIQLVRVAVRDTALHKEELARRGVECEVTDRLESVLDAPDLDGVVEVVGGIDAPLEWLQRALTSGKDVVTANKAVLAEHGESIFDLASQHGRQILFEGAVAGAIPILQVIRNGLSAGPIEKLTGILNGSTNWLLDAMAQGSSRQKAIDRARELGLLEQDPTLDLSGEDARHKLALLTRLLTSSAVDAKQIPTYGITLVDERDLRFGQENELTLKLLATMDREPSTSGGSPAVRLGVFPTWIPRNHPLASVRGEDNAILLEGPTFDRMLFQGKGAGGTPTAGAVVADIVRAARGLGHLPRAESDVSAAHLLEEPHSYYVRVSVRDEPGMLARIAETFARDQISLATVTQRPVDSNAVRAGGGASPNPSSTDPISNNPDSTLTADLFLVTHDTSHAKLLHALERLEPQDGIIEPPLWIPCLERTDS